MPTLASFQDRSLQILFLSVLFLIFICLSIGAIEIRWVGEGLQLPRIRAGSSLGLLFQTPEFVLLLPGGMLLAVLLPLLNPVPASFLTVAAGIPFVIANYINPGRQTLLPMEYSLLALLMLYAMNVLIGYFRETHARQNLINIFGQYIPPQLVQEIDKHPEQFDLSGDARRMTVFFSDLQNFSNVAEQLNPKQLALLLNEYFTGMTEILYRHNATIDKYIGDSIMAFWGAPVKQPDHALRSVLSAFEMQREIRVLSDSFSRRGWPGLNMGIGINTGMMNVGNMGSRYRVAYTVVGDAVNLAARLESLTREYPVPCIVSQATRDESNGVLFRELGVVQVKGKRKTTRIFEPVCPEESADSAVKRMLEFHAEGMAHFHEQHWQEAEKIFRFLAGEHESDRFYPYMLKKIQEAGTNRKGEGNGRKDSG